jgi:hypothetical protein
MLFLDQIQEQRKLGHITSTVLLDIKRAFDHVAQNWLLSILKSLAFLAALSLGSSPSSPTAFMTTRLGTVANGLRLG